MDTPRSKKTVLDHLSTLYYRKWFFIIPVILGAAIGYVVSVKMPEYYSSTTLVLAEEQQLPDQYVTPTDKTPFSQRLGTISQQIMSRARLEEIIKRYRLYQNEGQGVLASVLSVFSPGVAQAPALAAQAPVDDGLIERMRQDIEFRATGDESRKPGSTGNTFTITYTGRDPKTAMNVANTLASLFIEENNKVREQYAEGTSEFLGAELEKAKKELDGYEKALKDYKEAHMGSLPEQLDANLRTLDRLQLELQTVNAAIKNTDDRRIFLEEQMGMGQSGPTPANPLVGELDRLKNELRVLLSMYKESYPDVVITRKQIKDIEDQISRSRNKPEKNDAGYRNPAVYAELVTAKSQLGTLRQREAEIKKEIKEYQKRVEVTPANEQQQANLFRDYKISLQNYQALLEKKLNAKLAQNLEKRQRAERFRVIDPANLPQRPDRPDKMKIWIIGTMAGGAAGIGLVFLIEVLNPAFRKPEDFDGVISAPVLTSIPVIPVNPKRPAAGKLTVARGRK